MHLSTVHPPSDDQPLIFDFLDGARRLLGVGQYPRGYVEGFRAKLENEEFTW